MVMTGDVGSVKKWPEISGRNRSKWKLLSKKDLENIELVKLYANEKGNNDDLVPATHFCCFGFELRIYYVTTIRSILAPSC